MSGSEWQPNPAQRRAIEHTTGPLRIQAGAGGGKTTTLVQRILALLQAGHCQPGQVLMLTFTVKAVADMRAKVAAALPPGSPQPRIETYHAFALALVQEFAHHLGLPPDPVLLTEGPARLFTRLHFDRLGITALDLTRLNAAVGRTLDFFAWHRHEGTFRQPASGLRARLPAEADTRLLDQLLGAHAAYRDLLREQGAADYDDLIALALELLEQHPAVRQAVQDRYRFLLVDEYQDTDYLQGLFIRLLAAGHGNITIVGDPDQTIYSFRGAALSNILDFHRDWPGLVDIDMVTNYRSTPAIIQAANQVIRHNTRRKQAELVPHREQGGLPRPRLVQAPDFPAEAAWLAAELQRLHAAGTPWAHLHVLVRANRHKPALYAALVQAGIPARVVGGLDLFADQEAMRLVCYLRALAAPDADADLAVALGLPRYGLTDADQATLARQRDRQAGEPLLAAVERLAGADPRLQAFLAEFWPLYRRQHAEGCQAAIRGALALHAGSLSPQARANVEQLLPLAEGFLARPDLFLPPAGAPVPPLALFLRYLDELEGVDDSPEGVQLDGEENAVKLMTVHAAKGLEFPVVFLPRLTERDFHPRPRKWQSDFPLAWHHDPAYAADYAAMQAEEERRLFYVALTRARDRLYLSWAPVDPERKKPLGPSQFLDEVRPACDAEVLPGAGGTVQPELDLLPLLAPLAGTGPAPPLPVPPPAAGFDPGVPAVFSFSHLHAYQLCPYRFYLQFILLLPGRPAPAADQGVRIHAAIARLARARAEGVPVDFAAFAAWAAAPPAPAEADLAGAPAPPAAGEAPGADEPELEPPAAGPAAPGTADLRGALQHFWDSEYAQAAPVAAEQEFFLTLGGTALRGFIDRVHRRPDGGYEVVDFKVYNRLLTAAEVRRGLQLPLYIKACREALGLPVSAGALYFLKHGVTVRVDYTEAELAARWQEAERLLAGARARDWAPTPGKVCGYCPYGEICPAAAF